MGKFSEALQRAAYPYKAIAKKTTKSDEDLAQKDISSFLDLLMSVSKPFRTGANVLAQGYGPMVRGLTGGDPTTPGPIESFIRQGVSPEEQSYIDRKPYMAAIKSGVGIGSTMLPFAQRAVPAAQLGARTAQLAGRGAIEGLAGGLGYSREGSEVQDTLLGGALGVGGELLGNYALDPSYRSMVNQGWDSLADGGPGKYSGALKLGDKTAADPKNFASADEFIKAQGTPVYHGTSADFDVFEGGHRGVKVDTNGGFYFSPYKKTAENFGKNVKEVVLDIKNPKIAKTYREIGTLKKADIEQAIKEGYDGYYFKPSAEELKSGYMQPYNEEWVAFKPDQIKTKSQLTDIWKKAQVDNVADPLLAEARKYATAEEFNSRMGKEARNQLRESGVRGSEQIENFWNKSQAGGLPSLEGAMAHRPTRTGATVDNISQEVSEMGIPDFYEHPEWYHFGGKEYDESVSALMKLKDKPDADVIIYRASPKKELRKGDWVTLSKAKAKYEALTEKVPIHEFKVKARDVEFAGDDITEFGYWGSPLKK